MVEITAEIINTIEELSKNIFLGKTEIYNEFSVQHELGILLRNKLGNRFKVQFERNISYFGYSKNNFIKKEIDISIFSPDKSEKYAIELKFPRNGMHPEQMFSSCKDVQFIEELVKSGFNNAYFVFFADDPKFYRNGTLDGIYGYFRNGRVLHGEVIKPTGKRDQKLFINGNYKFHWKPIHNKIKYTFVSVKPQRNSI